MKRLLIIFRNIIIGLIGLGVVAVVLIWAITFHPRETQFMVVECEDNAPILQQGQSIKALTYNVQYMAGKNYVFYYDLPNDAGPDERPSSEDITATLAEVARIIKDEDPDFILLQEVDDGSKRTDYEDQLARLLSLLPGEYKCHTSAFYWKAGFVPHPRIMGAIGQKISIISKYRIDESTRYQLPINDADLLTRQFSPKRAILEARLPVEGGDDFMLLTTHLEVADRGAEIKQQEIAKLDDVLQSIDLQGNPWLLSGDFNLLPPGGYDLLWEGQQVNFRKVSEIEPLYNKYNVFPGPTEIFSDNPENWFTMFINDPSVPELDRTVDYFFYSDILTLKNAFLRNEDTLAISDHLPVIAEFTLPNQ